jgi:2-amino-4-hydroxy-6-hydroxymethyldihydropteridine diphosphokinase
MRYTDWAPQYRAIADEFSFPFAAEEEAADELIERLGEPGLEAPEERLRARLAGRTVVVVGLAPGLGAPPIARLAPGPTRPAIMAADGATDRCLRAGIVPDVITTDLDGPVPAEITANARGALVLIHAHGDNRAALREWVPQFPGAIAGSWAGPPRDGLANYGGFTDGDRAAFVAEAVGAEQILLFGFDFERAEGSDAEETARKLAKLRWAHRLLEFLAASTRVPMYWWAGDGTPTRLIPSVTAR